MNLIINFKVNLKIVIFLYISIFINSVQAQTCSKLINQKLSQSSEKGFATEINRNGEVIWNYTTGRSSDFIYSKFSHAPYGGSDHLVKSEINLLDEAGIIEENKAVLSLGEGAGLFIYDLIQKRESIGHSTDKIFAIDTVYTKKGKHSYLHPSREIGDLSQSNKKIKDRITTFLDEYPENYLNNGIFDLSIIDKKKGKILFDEIISSNALNYVLDGSSHNDRRLIIENLIGHLKPGGHLRSTPSFNDEIVTTIVKELVDQKIIKAIVLDNDQIIIKKIAH